MSDAGIDLAALRRDVADLQNENLASQGDLVQVDSLTLYRVLEAVRAAYGLDDLDTLAEAEKLVPRLEGRDWPQWGEENSSEYSAGMNAGAATVIRDLLAIIRKRTPGV